MNISGLKNKIDKLTKEEKPPWKIKITQTVVSGSAGGNECAPATKTTRVVTVDTSERKK